MVTTYLVVIIVLALVFDFINGFHDAANSIATVVSTRVLTPQLAVAWAAFFNFIALALFQGEVAASIAKGVEMRAVTDNVILATLLGAIIWNLVTWYFGLPSSSSHALMGALAGASLAHIPDLGILKRDVFFKVFVFIVVSPMLGMILGFLLMTLIRWAFANRRPKQVDRWFRVGQLASSALYSIGHGSNDAQKTIGIITLVLISHGLLHVAPGAKPHPPMWTAILCYVAMGLGTLSGGWRIVETMGMKITKLRPVGGFAAETAGALTLFIASHLGVPVSTTHTITGAIVGVGSTERRASAVRWGVAGRIVWAWIMTIPASAVLAGTAYLVARFLTGNS